MPRQTTPAALGKARSFRPIPDDSLYGLNNSLPYSFGRAAPYNSTLSRLTPSAGPAIHPTFEAALRDPFEIHHTQWLQVGLNSTIDDQLTSPPSANARSGMIQQWLRTSSPLPETVDVRDPRQRDIVRSAPPSVWKKPLESGPLVTSPRPSIWAKRSGDSNSSVSMDRVTVDSTYERETPGIVPVHPEPLDAD